MTQPPRRTFRGVFGWGHRLPALDVALIPLVDRDGKRWEEGDRKRRMGKERGETMWKRRVVIVDYDTSMQWTASRIPINCTCSSGIPRRAGQKGSHVSIYQNHSSGWLSKREREKERDKFSPRHRWCPPHLRPRHHRHRLRLPTLLVPDP